jgi:hypothetical protein
MGAARIKSTKGNEDASVSSKRGRRGRRRRRAAGKDEDDAVHNVLARESFPKARRGGLHKGRATGSKDAKEKVKYQRLSSMGAPALETIPEGTEEVSPADVKPSREVRPESKATTKVPPKTIAQKSVVATNPLIQKTSPEPTKETTESAEKLSDDMDTESDEEIVLSPDLLPQAYFPPEIASPLHTPEQSAIAQKKAGPSFSDPSVGTPAAKMMPGRLQPLQPKATLHSHPAGSKAQRTALRQIALRPPSTGNFLSFSPSRLHRKATPKSSSPPGQAPSVLETLQPPGGALLRKPVSDATLQVYRTCRPDNANVMQAMMAPPPVVQEGRDRSLESATPQSAVHIENVVLHTDHEGTPIVEDDEMSALTLETADERDMWLAKEGQARGAKRPRRESSKPTTTTDKTASKPLSVQETSPVVRRRSTSGKHSKQPVPSAGKLSSAPEMTTPATDAVVYDNGSKEQPESIRLAKPSHASPAIDAAAILTRMGSPQEGAEETESEKPASTPNTVKLQTSFPRQSTTSFDDAGKEGAVGSDGNVAHKGDETEKEESPPVRLESPEDSSKISRSSGSSDQLSSPRDEPLSNQVDTPTSSSSVHPLRMLGNKRLYTKEVAGLKNLAPIIRFPNGDLYVHPALPPGWRVAMSKSRGKPYYYHPDFGRSFYPPIVLPSEDGITRGDCSPTIVEARSAASSPVGSVSLFEDDSRASLPSTCSSPAMSPSSSQCLDSSALELSGSITRKDLPVLTEPIHCLDWESPSCPANESKENHSSPLRLGESSSTEKEVAVCEHSAMGTVDVKMVTTEATPVVSDTLEIEAVGETARLDFGSSDIGADANTFSGEGIKEPTTDPVHEEDNFTVGHESDKANDGADPQPLAVEDTMDATSGRGLEEEEPFTAGYDSDQSSGGHDLGSENEDVASGDKIVSMEGGVLAHFEHESTFRTMSHQDEGSLSSLTSCVSARARYPPMPLCSLQHLEALEVYQSSTKKRKKAQKGELKKDGKRRLAMS